eukprot:403343783
MPINSKLIQENKSKVKSSNKLGIVNQPHFSQSLIGNGQGFNTLNSLTFNTATTNINQQNPFGQNKPFGSISNSQKRDQIENYNNFLNKWGGVRQIFKITKVPGNSAYSRMLQEQHNTVVFDRQLDPKLLNPDLVNSQVIENLEEINSQNNLHDYVNQDIQMNELNENIMLIQQQQQEEELNEDQIIQQVDNEYGNEDEIIDQLQSATTINQAMLTETQQQAIQQIIDLEQDYSFTENEVADEDNTIQQLEQSEYEEQFNQFNQNQISGQQQNPFLLPQNNGFALQQNQNHQPQIELQKMIDQQILIQKQLQEIQGRGSNLS